MEDTDGKGEAEGESFFMSRVRKSDLGEIDEQCKNVRAHL